MKKLFCLLLCVLTLACLPALAEEKGILPADSGVYDGAFAQRALQIAESTGMPVQKLLLMQHGFRQAGEYNMTRAADDARHVAAYAVYEKKLPGGGAQVIFAVRATGEGEWPLNLDLMPSGDYTLDYAENFFLAAQDILDTQADYLNALQDPVFLVTGYSRGAAVANVLAARLTDRFGAENVYGYTFASPCTVRGEYAWYGNIFNVVNPCDLVTWLPLPQWGFARYGTDIPLPVDGADAATLATVAEAYDARADKTAPFGMPENGSAAVRALVQAMAEAMPAAEDAFSVRHALKHTGPAAADEAGMTGGELLLKLLTGNNKGAEMAALMMGKNDFSALIKEMLALSAGSGGGIGLMHMPAVYGAWMTVIE